MSLQHGIEAVGSQLDETVHAIRDVTSLEPRVALILGSGLGALVHEVSDGVSIPYSDLPHVPMSTAPGHEGRLVVGAFEDSCVAVMAGRVHMYEGYSAAEVTYLIRCLKRLGVEILVVTNAAGGVNTAYRPGNLMVISDHINLTGRNPLIGAHDSTLGTRFPDMSHAYDPELRTVARDVASAAGLPVREGVYLALLGPSYETPAEIRMARALGADAVGMSTAMEVIAANHADMRVLGISCITNMAAGILPQKLTEEEVIETAASVQGEFATLIHGVIRRLAMSRP